MSEVKKFIPTSPVTLTQAAVTHIKKRVQQTENACGLRLSVKKAGCSGYMYVTDVITQAIETDLVFQVEKDLTIYVDCDSFLLLEGLQVDYVEKDLGLKRLVFINPNEKGQCGCGESFLV